MSGKRNELTLRGLAASGRAFRSGFFLGSIGQSVILVSNSVIYIPSMQQKAKTFVP